MHSPRSYWALIVTQFQGAFSDNAFKTLVSFLVVQGQLEEHGKGLVLLVGALFAVPFLVFSMTGGFLADRFSKRSVTIGTKWMEIGVMCVALAGLAGGFVTVQLVAVFLMSVQSALFSPSKYGLLPEILPERRLSWGNGILNFATFLAIISGIVTGGLLAEGFGPSQHWSGVTLVGLAFFGLATATLIGRVPAADPARRFHVNFVSESTGQLAVVRRHPLLNLAVLASGYFYFVAAFLQFNILFYGLEVLRVGETQNSILMAAVAVGIGAGSLVAGFLSGGKIEYGLVPLGGLGMALAAFLLVLPELSYVAVAVLLAGLGYFGGFFSVPVAALVQHLPDRHEKGRVLAATNMVCFLGVALASAVYYLFVLIGWSPSAIFLISGLMTLVATGGLVRLQPDAVLRMGLWVLTHTLYRLRVEGRRHIPDKGPALFVAGPLGFVEGLLLVAATDRPVYFFSAGGDGRGWAIRLLGRLMGALEADTPSLNSDGGLELARQRLDAGEAFCIIAAADRATPPPATTLQQASERLREATGADVLLVSLDSPGFDPRPRNGLRLASTLLAHAFSTVVVRVEPAGDAPVPQGNAAIGRLSG